MRIWKWIGIGIGALAGIALAAVAYIYIASSAIAGRTYPLPPSNIHAATDSHAVERGLHLARGFGCMDCHRKNLQGGLIPSMGVSARNLTRLAAIFSDADFDRAIRHGLRPDGTSVAEFMPSDAFRYMTDRDMADLLAYIRSVKPAGPDIPVPSYSPLFRVALLLGKEHTDQYWFGVQKPALDLGPRYARGRELAMAACGECHMTPLAGAPPEMPGPRPPDLSLVASYDRADFLKFMHTGKAAGNRELPMMSAVARVRLSHFTDAQLNAIYDYLAARGRKLTGSAS